MKRNADIGLFTTPSSVNGFIFLGANVAATIHQKRIPKRPTAPNALSAVSFRPGHDRLNQVQ
jgi:hypothetical protein